MRPRKPSGRSPGRAASDCCGPRYVRQSFPRHTHDHYVVCLDERGAHASWYRGANVVIPERAITVVPPGAVHSGQIVPGRPWHYRAMYLSVDLITALATEIGLARRMRGGSGSAIRAISPGRSSGSSASRPLGFTVFLAEMAANIATTVLFYVLLRPVDRTAAQVALVFGLVGCTIKTLARAFYYAPLLILGGADYLSVFSTSQPQALA